MGPDFGIPDAVILQRLAALRMALELASWILEHRLAYKAKDTELGSFVTLKFLG